MAECLCGREKPPQAGKTIRVGDIIGFAIEPQMRYARVVGWVKGPLPSLPRSRVLVREFRPFDGRWPTGNYVRPSWITPWEHEHPQTELRLSQEPPFGGWRDS